MLPDRWEEFCWAARRAGARTGLSASQTLQGLTEHADALHAALDEIFVRRPTQAWLDLLEPAEILVAPVHDYAEIVQSEQARVNGYIQELDHPTLGPLPVVGAPVEMSEARIAPRGPAPELGQHTEELLLELGYDWDRDHAAPRRRRDLAQRAPQLCSAPSNSTSRISLPLFRQRSKSASSSRPWGAGACVKWPYSSVPLTWATSGLMPLRWLIEGVM